MNLKPTNSKVIVALLLFISLLNTNVLAQLSMLHINEVMSSNKSTLFDNDGDFPDWIELYYNGNQTLTVSGCGLSDDFAEPHKWIIPTMDINPGQFVVIFASDKNQSNWVAHWETVVDWGDTWRYQLDSSTIPSSWIQPGFSDNHWQNGPSGFGFGYNYDDNTATRIGQTTSLFLRTEFEIENVQAIGSAVLHIDYDDGFIAYLNGHEIARANLGIEGVQPPYNLQALTHREAELYQGGVAEKYDVDSAILQQGTNVLAIQVHDAVSIRGAEDLSAIPFFTLGMKVPPSSPRGPSEHLRLSVSSLHTNFKISSSGESIYLSDAEGNHVDSVAVPKMITDISYGRYPDGSDNLRMFSNPTPGSDNDPTGPPEMASMPQFSHEAGFYDEPFNLNIIAPNANAVVRYTTDGSIPESTSQQVTGPIYIGSNIVIRIRAFEAGKQPSETVTHSFFINESITLPVVSITTKPENLWDENIGIYVLGPPDYLNFPPYPGANFWEDWERPIHIEFFENDGRLGFSTGAGMKNFGVWSRSLPQKSVSIFFRGVYGLGELNYPLFPQLPFTDYQAFILRNSGNDWDRTMFCDAMMQTLVESLDLETQAYRPCVTFMNGEYWGILNIREKMNEHYIASHHDVDPDNIDLLEGTGKLIHGDTNHYQTLLNYVATNDMSDPAHYAQVKQWMEIENYIEYNICEIYFDNRDWPRNNIKFWRPRTEDGRWRWMLYDTDFGFGLNSYGEEGNENAYDFNTLAHALSPEGSSFANPPNATQLLRGLMENEEFRNAFINRSADLFNTIFSPNDVVDHIDSLAAIIEPEMERHYLKWREPVWWLDVQLNWASLDDWYSYVDTMRTFARNRIAYMKTHIRQQFNLPGDAFVRLDVEPIGAGHISINRITPKEYPWTGTYFQNVPVPLVAHPEPGYRFIRWEGSVSDSSAEILVEHPTNSSITAVFEIK